MGEKNTKTTEIASLDSHPDVLAQEGLKVIKEKDYYFVDVAVGIEDGLNMDPIKEIYDQTAEYKHEVEITNNLTRMVGYSDSLFSLAVLEASKGTPLTLKSKDKDALKAVYNIINNPKPQDATAKIRADYIKNQYSKN